MNQPLNILIFAVIVGLIVWFLYRSMQKRTRQALSGKRLLDDQNVWLRFARPLPARVLNKNSTIKPEATGIAKVELELEIQMPEGNAVNVGTIWLVEIVSLYLLDVGKTVEVKFDPQKPGRVFPAVPWARLWLFGK